ncbi:MAG: hypothetical protein GY722_05550 [bacterium]|nr:hypothetical protein [bacterium]
MEQRKLELKVFETLQDADASDVVFYSAMAPRERLNMVLELSARYWGDSDEAVERHPRFHRVVELDLH